MHVADVLHVLAAPQQPLKWGHVPHDLFHLAKKLIDDDRVALDTIAELPPKDCTFSSVFVSASTPFSELHDEGVGSQLALADAEAALTNVLEPLAFYQNVSPSRELREASNAAEALVRDYQLEAAMRLDVYQAKLNARRNIRRYGEPQRVTGEMQRLVDRMMLDGTRAGLALSQTKRSELTLLQKELSARCLEFNRNINEEKGSITFAKDELRGVPEDVISGYTKHTIEDEKAGSKEVYDVSFNTHDILPIFKFAKNPNTRQRAHEGHESRLQNNVPVLSKILALRRRIARLLGYRSWADYITEVKMIQSSSRIQNLINDLLVKLRPVGLKERDVLLALKKQDCLARGLPFDGQLYAWDYRYYDRKYVDETLGLDEVQVAGYFPVSVVIPRILEMYQDLFGVRFVEVEGEGKKGTNGEDGEKVVWHRDVELFAVWEKDAKDYTGFLGYCYLDLYAREAKHPHAAVWPLIQGFQRAFERRTYPVVVLIANLAKPALDSAGQPALMRHEDVVTFFHEMGHVFHGLMSQTRFARFHGTRVASDFVEVPSRMLENWCWDPRVLEQISCHYKTQRSLPPELILKIVRSRHVNVALFYLRQLFYAKFDLQVHVDKADQDYTKVWNTMREEIALVKTGLKMCPGQGTFGHLANGYDAGYYGFIYSLVLAADMYATVFKIAPLDPVRGRHYRDKILRPGASQGEMRSIQDFLGREPRSEPFMRQIFESPSAAGG